MSSAASLFLFPEQSSMHIVTSGRRNEHGTEQTSAGISGAGVPAQKKGENLSDYAARVISGCLGTFCTAWTDQ